MKEENVKKSEEKNVRKSKTGRKKLANPAIYVHYIYLNEMDNVRFDTLFHLSGFKYRSHFIRDQVLNHPPKVIRIDKTLLDYAMKLSQFRRQFQKIGVNYNQLLRLLKEQLGEQKALAFLYKLEKVTIELVCGHKILEGYIKRFEERWLQK